MPFYYKGYDVNTIITKGNSSVPETAYKGFPSYNPSNNADLDKVKNDLLFQIDNTDVVSTSNIQAASYKSVNINGSYPIPAWCNGVKFYISSAKGSSGSGGGAGSKGDQGPKGAKGQDNNANGCPKKAIRPKNGGQGGPGGEGGDGGPGGDGGEGGAGVYFYSTKLIPVSGVNSVSIDTIKNMSLTISNSNYTANNGDSGNKGEPGNKGETGGQGNQGSDGSQSCQGPGTASSGNTGTKGAAGNKGAKGITGTAGAVSSPNTVTVISDTHNSDSKEITIYFFATT